MSYMASPRPTQEGQEKIINLTETMVEMAKKTEKQTNKLISLTRVITLLTIAMIILIIFQIYFALVK